MQLSNNIFQSITEGQKLQGPLFLKIVKFGQLSYQTLLGKVIKLICSDSVQSSSLLLLSKEYNINWLDYHLKIEEMYNKQGIILVTQYQLILCPTDNFYQQLQSSTPCKVKVKLKKQIPSPILNDSKIIEEPSLHQNVFNTISQVPNENKFNQQGKFDVIIVKGCFFDKQCNDYFDKIIVGQVLLFRNGVFQNKGQQLNSIFRFQDVVFNSQTVIERITQTPIIQQFCQWKTIEQIQQLSNGSIINLSCSKGVLIKVTDDSVKHINVNLSKTLFQSTDLKPNQIIGLVNFKVDQYMGHKCMQSFMVSEIILDLQQCQDQEFLQNNLIVLQQLKDKQKSNEKDFICSSQHAVISQMQIFVQSNQNVNQCFLVEAYILNIPVNQSFCYEACYCCLKKIQADNNNIFICRNCNKQFRQPFFRYLFKIQLVDQTGSIFVTIFHNEAQQLIGTIDKRQSILQSLLYNSFVFHIRISQQKFNDNQRIVFNLIKIEQVDINKHCQLKFDWIMQQLN